MQPDLFKEYLPRILNINFLDFHFSPQVTQWHYQMTGYISRTVYFSHKDSSHRISESLTIVSISSEPIERVGPVFVAEMRFRILFNSFKDSGYPDMIAYIRNKWI